jgi:hypothetical protein
MKIQYEARTLSGRCANGAARDAGRVVHALYAPAHAFSTALCGARPGRTSGAGFGEASGAAVTCPRCLARIAKPRVPRLQPATVELLRDVAAGRSGYSCPDIAEAVRGDLKRHCLISWITATEALLAPGGIAVLALLDGPATLEPQS